DEISNYLKPHPPHAQYQQISGEYQWLSQPTKWLFNAEPAERAFLSVPTPDGARQTSRDFSNVPHLAGSPADFEQAKAILKIFQENFGVTPTDQLPLFDAGSVSSRQATLSIPTQSSPQAWIDTYYPILNTPLERELQVIGNDGKVIWNADVEEVEVEGDEAGKFAKTIGAWHGLSKAGDVMGKLVYVNYGRKEDFEELATKGVDLKGTIAIARYGGIFRGLKVKGAQEAGAIGCLIYSDPRDDGSVTMENGYKPYPDGPARHPDSVQRGSVQFLSMYPGDPSTPGYPSYPNATRSSSLNIPSIPSLPISWNNAKKLLQEISPSFNFTLDGAMSSTSVRLKNDVDVKVTPIWNTMAVVPGHIPDEVVILGCHRDAWVLGAGDPTSGTTAIVEIAKSVGTLLKKGWKPLRTLVIASWDAEEASASPGLVGSTEFGEDFEDFIREHVVAYLNVDVATKGSKFSLGGSPSLAHLLIQAATDLPHPTDANRTLLDARNDAGKLTGPAGGSHPKKPKRPLGQYDTGVRPLGSGSDYTVFLQRIGVASSDEGFGGTLTDPVYHYHSVYDSHRWQELYTDPGFHRHVAVAKHLGLVTLRMINTPVIPLNTTQYAYELDDYLAKVRNATVTHSIPVDLVPLERSIRSLQRSSVKLDRSRRRALRKLEKALKHLRPSQELFFHAFEMSRCSKRRWSTLRTWIKRVFGVPTTVEAPGHALYDEVSARASIEPYQGAAPDADISKHHKALRRAERALSVIRNLNKKLSSFERGFISKEGIKDREWYRNVVVAPGKWTGYGATTFPALTEAIVVEKNATLAQEEVQRLSTLLRKLSKELNLR
ncbi:hypothetical protein FRB99_003091, partial [Tulasnella sp. 403]